MRTGAASLSLAVVAAGTASCAPAIPVSFDSPEPGARNAAIVRAAASRRREDLPSLVRMLDSDDPVTRMLAIRTLERLTGDTLGYDAAAPAWERCLAVAKWQDSVRMSHDATSPDDAPSPDQEGGDS
jgi:hypothetical protein